MRILVTGATGYIGGAVAEALQRAGHVVFGLAHKATTAAEIEAQGWTPVRGDISDPAGLERTAGAFEGVVHAANTGGPEAAEVETEAVRALLRAMRVAAGRLIYTSGAWVLGSGRLDERSPVNPTPLIAWRGALEREVLRAAPAVQAVVLRPGIVYGRGGGIPGMLARGEVAVIGDGAQRWPLVHVEDLAGLYVLGLEAPAGAVLHGVSATLTMREVALLGTAARGTVPAAAQPLEEARARLGAFADALALDQVISGRITRDLLGWRPVAASPVEEILAGSYTARRAA